jgi:tetratricopeptide (TPR) repeat protein
MATQRRRSRKLTRERKTEAAGRSPGRKNSLSGAPLFVAIFAPVLVAVLGFLAFYPALDAEFVSYDDDRLFATNTSYRGFDAEHIKWMFKTTFMGHYQPLTWLSSALDYKISGIDPSSYHRNNLILHGLNGLLLYFVAMRLFAAALRLEPNDVPLALRISSAVSALLFAVHPLRVESVAWASERRDVLSAFFLLPALLCYLRAVRPREVALRSWAWYVGSWGLLILSLLSKAWGMSFVALVVVLDVYPLRRLPEGVSRWWDRPYRAVWFQKLPYLMLGLAAAVKAGLAQRSALDTMRSLEEWGVSERVVQVFYGLAFYVWKTIWPTRLSACYELPYRLDPFQPRYVIAFLAVVIGLGMVIRLRRRWPGLLAAAIVYGITLAPVLGFAQSGQQLVADRYSYVSCMGWALLAGGGMLSLWRRRPTWGLQIAIGACMWVVTVLLFAATSRQTVVWHDSKSLWGHALSVSPSATAHLNYGILLRKEGRVDEAVEHYRQAVELKPDFGNAWFAMGNVLKQKKDYVEAEKAYREAVRFMTQKHSGYLNLGNLYYNNLGRLDDAIAAYRSAVDHVEAFRSKMFTPTPYLALGIALRDQGDIEGARRALEVATKYRRTRERAEEELQRLGRKE